MNADSKFHEAFATFRHRGVLEDKTPGREYGLRCVWNVKAASEDREELKSLEGALTKVLPDSAFLKTRQFLEKPYLEIESDYATLKSLIEDDQEGSSLFQSFHSASRRAFDSWNTSEYSLSLPRGRTLQLGGKVFILGIVNVTPDSFSDGGLFFEQKRAIDHALSLLEDGADGVDIGGESTRPGSDPVSEEEEIRRVIGVIEGIRQQSDAVISIDTSKAEVAKRAIEAGADIVNDVSAGSVDPEMFPTLAQYPDVPFVLMHMKGTPKTMQIEPVYEHATFEICSYLESRIAQAEESGIEKNRCIIDPGYGFGKRSEDNLNLLRHTDEFKSLGVPVFIGLSRKSFLGRLLGNSLEEREIGTVIANTLVSLAGAAIVRTHHAANAREMVALLEALRA